MRSSLHRTLPWSTCTWSPFAIEIGRQVAALVIPAQQEEGVWVLDLEGKEVQDHLAAKATTVHVVPRNRYC